MYHETYHPVSERTLEFVLQNKSYDEEERRLIREGVQKANEEKKRKFRVDLPSGEYVEFDNGLYIGGEAQ